MKTFPDKTTSQGLTSEEKRAVHIPLYMVCVCQPCELKGTTMISLFGLSTCSVFSCSVFHTMLGYLAQMCFASNLHQWRGCAVLWCGLMCWKRSILPSWTLGVGSHSVDRRWKPAVTHSSAYSPCISFLCHLLCKTRCNSSSEIIRRARVYGFIHAGWGMMHLMMIWILEMTLPLFLSLLFSVTFWMDQQCVSIEWRMLFGFSRETSCIRRGLSTSGQSSRARCPTRAQEL